MQDFIVVVFIVLHHIFLFDVGCMNFMGIWGFIKGLWKQDSMWSLVVVK